MKKLIFITLCIIALSAKAQTDSISDNSLPSFAGVSFGMDYFSCKKILDDRFNQGKYSVQGKINKTLEYQNVTFGGEHFDLVFFDFQLEGTTTYLSSAEFFVTYPVSESESAKKQRDRLFNSYSKKYKLLKEDTDRNGYKYYNLGENPFDPNSSLVSIGILKHEGEDGTPLLTSFVLYGPVNFIKQDDDKSVNPIDEI